MYKIPLADLKLQYLGMKDEIDEAIHRVILNSSFILGPEVTAFENEFAAHIGSKYAVGVASGTAALELSLRACGVGPGDEVITSTLTFFATAEAISNTGAKPVFVDINPNTYNIDPNKVEDAITKKTKAIIPVHLHGQSADMDPLLEIANRKGLFVIEDAAQGHNAKYKGRFCGTMGHLGCFSFYPGKNLGAYGDAGAVTGNDEALIKKVKKLRDHGRITKYEHDEIAFAERMDGLQAAILRAKLPHLNDWTEKRRANAKFYNEILKGLDVVLPTEMDGAYHNYHVYAIRTEKRDQLLDHLKSQGVEVAVHYPIPLHRQPAFMKEGYDSVSLPVAEEVVRGLLSLPIYAELTAGNMKYIGQVIREFLDLNR